MKYVVKRGDTLYGISKIYGISVSELIEYNNLKSTNLSIGQELIIPSNNQYVVEKGDTLYSISRKTGVSVSDLIIINGLSSTVLQIGQVLNLTSTVIDIPIGSSCMGRGYVETNYITHTVKKGDNLYSIGRMYGVSVDSIKKLNNLSSNLLNIGQVLKIKEDI